MLVPEEKNIFRKEPYRPNPYAVVILIILIIGAISALVQISNGLDQGTLNNPLAATPTPTRNTTSYLMEAEAFYAAGNLTAAIDSYQDAINHNPDNGQALAELARLQTYYSSIVTTNQKTALLEQAKANIDLAVEIDPENSDVYAIKALVYDWYTAVEGLTDDQINEYLLDAYDASVKALTLDTQNVLALTFQAEILQDQFNFAGALQNAELAIQLDPNLMDAHRVYGYIMESRAQYALAIEAYKDAVALNPNFTYLYIKIGQNYRQLLNYEMALDYFDQAATINAINGIEDPIPYLAIATTYTRDGEFFAASLNMQRALDFDPQNPDIYGQLGVLYFRARNYESSIPALRCAISGCTAEENEEQEIAIAPLELNDSSIFYYYTFASVLSALNQCDEALPLMDTIEARYGNDTLVMGIIDENRQICQIFAAEE